MSKSTAKRVAVVDDSTIVLKTVRHVLTKAGFEVITMNEPQQRSLVGGGTVDLILVDVNMPQVYGDDLPSFFRDVWGISAPTYLYSDLEEGELARRAQSAGATGYICKSWGPDELVRRVTQLLG
jgi:DNA-binding response OmpR family regulator